MKHSMVSGLFLAGLFGVASPVIGQEPERPEQPARPEVQRSAPETSGAEIDRLIDTLGAEDFQERRRAERELRRIGDEARGALEDAIKHADDPEVRWRAHRVLRALDRSGGRTQEGLRPRGQDAEAEGDAPFGTGPEAEWRRRMQEQLERAFGPGDARFRDLQEQVEEMQRHIDEMMRGMPAPPAFGVPPGGIDLDVIRHGTSIQIGPDGVRVEVEEQGEDGESERKVYEADSIEDFRKQYPDVARRFLPGGGPNVFRIEGFGGQPWVTAPQLRGRLRAQGAPEPLAAPAPEGPRLGVYVAPLAAEVREFLGIEADQGLLVERVQAGSLAESLGIQPKDVILRLAGRAVASPEDVADALAEVEGGATVEAEVNRMGESVRLTAEMPAGKSASTPAPTKLRRVEVR